MIDAEQLRRRAARRYREIRKRRSDRRFLRAVGKLMAAGLLQASFAGAKHYRGPVRLADALWAGEVEQRILELLPAVVVKLPKLFVLPDELPDDLVRTVRAIRLGRDHPQFRGVDPAGYLPWVERVGTRGKAPSTLRSFRLRPDDLARLHRLKQALPAPSETEVIRIALRLLDGDLGGVRD